MVKARVQRSRVHIMRHTHLPNAPQPLEIGVINNLEQKTFGHRNETVHRVVEYLPLTLHNAMPYLWQR